MVDVIGIEPTTSSAHFGSETRPVLNKKPRFRVVSKWWT